MRHHAKSASRRNGRRGTGQRVGMLQQGGGPANTRPAGRRARPHAAIGRRSAGRRSPPVDAAIVEPLFAIETTQSAVVYVRLSSLTGRNCQARKPDVPWDQTQENCKVEV